MIAGRRIGELIDLFRDRGDLPERILVTLPDSPFLTGEILEWSEKEKAYTRDDCRYFVWPDYVRKHWGRHFQAAPDEQQDLAL